MRSTLSILGQYGVIKDQPAHELPDKAFSDARNVRFKDGQIEKMLGQTQVFSTPTVTPYFVTPFNTGNVLFWAYAGTGKVFVHDGDTETEITPASDFTGVVDNRWSGGVLNGNLILNNGVENPQYWNGNIATNLATLTNWNTNWKCKAMRPFKQYLIAMNVTKSGIEYPSLFKWSDIADAGQIPPDWDETNVAIDAGEQDLSETPDILVDGMALGDAFIAYKERSMYAVRRTFDARIFSFQRLPGEVGCLAVGCVADTPVGHIVLTAGDVILHSGQGPVSIADGVIRRWIFDNIDGTYYQRSFLAHNPAKNEVWVCFPETGETTCTIAAVYNYIQKNWTIRELPNVTYGANGQLGTTNPDPWSGDGEAWNDDTTTWNSTEYQLSDNSLVVTTTAPRLDVVDTGGTFAGTAYTSYVERTGLPFGEPWRWKVMKSIVPRINGVAGRAMTIEMGAQPDPEESTVYTATITYTIGTTYKADGFASGRFLAYKMSSTDSQPYTIKSIDVEYEMMGEY